MRCSSDHLHSPPSYALGRRASVCRGARAGLRGFTRLDTRRHEIQFPNFAIRAQKRRWCEKARIPSTAPGRTGTLSMAGTGHYGRPIANSSAISRCEVPGGPPNEAALERSSRSRPSWTPQQLCSPRHEAPAHRHTRPDRPLASSGSPPLRHMAFRPSPLYRGLPIPLLSALSRAPSSCQSVLYPPFAVPPASLSSADGTGLATTAHRYRRLLSVFCTLRPMLVNSLAAADIVPLTAISLSRNFSKAREPSHRTGTDLDRRSADVFLFTRDWSRLFHMIPRRCTISEQYHVLRSRWLTSDDASKTRLTLFHDCMCIQRPAISFGHLVGIGMLCGVRSGKNSTDSETDQERTGARHPCPPRLPFPARMGRAREADP
ncbi:hypothetical protein CALCODRAFT_22279 [Calocera cornea HHB12733]|uniref:Uncharacterized protein n=1 Tax=Calocera cornea HHB12733 TaxID=1353952 RepID=A0A165E574_9BASI|nr:hypothetical protein CALCODRAFT_22279 [Calocera cornea HHB12733]